MVRCPVVILNRPLRIGLLSYRSKPHCGGQGVYVRHLSRELCELGHHVEVFSGQPYPELDPGPVAYEMLDTDAALPRGGIDVKDHMSAIEIGLIRKALEEADGTVAGAARLLRIRRTTLVEKLRKYRLSA